MTTADDDHAVPLKRGQAHASWMNNGQPLRPDEDEYRTAVATDEVEPDPRNPAESSPPWIVVGLVFLVAFVVVLVWAVVLPVIR
jgi:hypothetical protein